MKARKARNPSRKNPTGVATFAWAVGTSAVTGLATYFVLREVYAAQIVSRCAVLQGVKQQIGMQTGTGPVYLPPVTKERARAWF